MLIFLLYLYTYNHENKDTDEGEAVNNVFLNKGDACSLQEVVGVPLIGEDRAQLIMDFGYKATPQQPTERGAANTKASNSRSSTRSFDQQEEHRQENGVDAEALAAAKATTEISATSFDDVAEGADELIRDEDMHQDDVQNTAAPPSWWEHAWAHTERKNADDITNRMNRMFIVQCQRMDTIEQRGCGSKEHCGRPEGCGDQDERPAA